MTEKILADEVKDNKVLDPDNIKDSLMTLEEMQQHEWVVGWSGGKDSTATIILMHENNVPIKKIVYVRMMYDDVLPATLPIMTDFVDLAAETFREWGYTVEFVKPEKTFVDCANKVYKRSKHPERIGKRYGIAATFRGGVIATYLPPREKLFIRRTNMANIK